MIAHSRKLCSCWMCGNPRRYFGQPTFRELQADESPPPLYANSSSRFFRNLILSRSSAARSNSYFAAAARIWP